ncbi:MAG: AAA family ATPase [Ktedonobacterales bacterium]
MADNSTPPKLNPGQRSGDTPAPGEWQDMDVGRLPTANLATRSPVMSGPRGPMPGGPRGGLNAPGPNSGPIGPQMGAAGPNSGPIGQGANGASLGISLPPRPSNVAETGLDAAFLEDLTLKMVASLGTVTGNDLAERLYLPLAGVVEPIISSLRRENLIEPVGGGAAMIGAAGMNLRATERGAQRAHLARERSGYEGPAPVPLVAFEYALRQQSTARRFAGRDVAWRRLAHLVLPNETMDRVGAAVESGGPLFLYGHPGNGKTAIGAAVARMLSGGVLVPYAVEVDEQVFRVFDPSIHKPIPADAMPATRFDERWVLCQTPFVQVGGELRLEQLDLHWHDRQHYYDCPIQLKAAGGVLLIDDFGRQQHRPEELLNRWIVPLETGIDYLTLINGRQVALSFTPLLVFATNLDPSDLIDEAFLRRLPCKIEVPDPVPEAFREIWRRTCADMGVEYSEAGLTHLIDTYYGHLDRTPRASHPRDLLRLVVAAARYFGVAPQTSRQLLDVAASMYFV